MSQNFVNENIFDAAKQAYQKYKDYMESRNILYDKALKKDIDLTGKAVDMDAELRNIKDREERDIKYREYKSKVDIALRKIDKEYKDEIKGLNKEHPVASSAFKGEIAGLFAGIPLGALILCLLENMYYAKNWSSTILLMLSISGFFGTVVATTIIGWLVGAGLGSLVNKLKNSKKDESLGLKILGRLNCLCEEEEEAGSEDPDAQGLSDDNVEQSETLKKLRGHLYRFQEDDSTKKTVAAGTIGGAVLGRQLARRAEGNVTGANKAIKNVRNAVKGAKKNQAYFADKALTQHGKSKVSKIMGNKAAADVQQKAATASAKAAEKNQNLLKNAGKTINKLKGTMNAAGRWGLLKGAGIGAVGVYAGKKAYDKYKQNH